MNAGTGTDPQGVNIPNNANLTFRSYAGTSGDNAYMYMDTNNVLRIYNKSGLGGNTALISLHSNGKIGIGDISTGAKLYVKGAGNSSLTSSLNVNNSDNNSIFYVRDDGKIGIGTTTLEQKLNVDGTIQMTGFKMPTAAVNGYVLTTDASGVGTWQTVGIDGEGTSGYLPKFTASTILSNSVVYESVSGYVGIGTTNPASKLNIREDSAKFIIADNTNRRLEMQVRTGYDPTIVLDVLGTSGAFSIRRGGVDALVIKNDKKVGINIINPSDILSVNGNIGLPRFSSDNWAHNILFKKARGTENTPTTVNSNDEIGKILFYGYDGSNYQLGAKIYSNVDANPGPNDMPGNLCFATTPDGTSVPVDRVTITSDGHVGIGTTNPKRFFHVSGGSVLFDQWVNVEIGTTGGPQQGDRLYVAGNSKFTGNVSVGGTLWAEGVFSVLGDWDVRRTLYSSSYWNADWFEVTAGATWSQTISVPVHRLVTIQFWVQMKNDQDDTQNVTVGIVLGDVKQKNPVWHWHGNREVEITLTVGSENSESATVYIENADSYYEYFKAYAKVYTQK